MVYPEWKLRLLFIVVHPKLPAMRTSELKTDIASLQYQFDHYNDLLDKAISKNVKFTIKKIISRKLKEISERLNKIRGLWEA
jgi:hypothetical protein